MEKTKKYFILMLALLGTAFSNPFLSHDSDAPSQVLLKDIGILGLASHDIFSWNSNTQSSQENGRLDLSTVFANDKNGLLIKGDWYHAKEWQSGGNKKNSENAPVYTITQLVIERFKTYLDEYGDPNTARRCVVNDFHEALRASVERMIGIEFPHIARQGQVNNQEQAAYRVFHDILPAYIIRDNGKTFSVTDPKTLKTMLTETELNQPISFYNGGYDPEYKNIQTGAPWYAKRFFGAPSNINLMALDSAFIQTYGEHFTQASGLQELCDYAHGHCDINDVSFVHHIISMFEKAQCKYNQDVQKTLNPWIPEHIQCLQ